jgi:hypothetical protein
MSNYQARITKTADGSFYALIVRIDRDGEENVIHGYKGRHFATVKGRKPVKQGEDTVTVSLRMTTEQRAKLARLGGAEWVRTKIDKARET